MTERSDSILRHSTFDILRFFGSLFNFTTLPGSTKAGPSIPEYLQNQFALFYQKILACHNSLFDHQPIEVDTASQDPD